MRRTIKTTPRRLQSDAGIPAAAFPIDPDRALHVDAEAEGEGEDASEDEDDEDDEDDEGDRPGATEGEGVTRSKLARADHGGNRSRLPPKPSHPPTDASVCVNPCRCLRCQPEAIIDDFLGSVVVMLSILALMSL